MPVDLQQAAWLKSESLGVLAVPAAGVAWGASRANALEFTSPIDAVADANTEAARTIAILAGPNVKDSVLVKGHRRDLLFKCVTVTSDRLGYGDLGPELVVNGDGSSAAGWTAINGAALSSVGGRLRVTNTAALNGDAAQAVPIVAGRAYRGRVTRSPGNAAFSWAQFSTPLPTYPINASGNGTVTEDATFVADGATVTISLLTDNTIGHYSEFDDISLREVGRRVFVIGVMENSNNTTTLTVIRSLV